MPRHIPSIILMFLIIGLFASVVRSATLYVYDVSGKQPTLSTFDEQIFIASVQGIVNREIPRLFIINNPKEDTALLSSILQAEGHLNKAVIEKIANIPDFIRIFRPYIKGLCIWDPEIPATLNAAITVAGAENFAIVRYDPSPDSLFTKLTSSEGVSNIPIGVNFVGKFAGADHIPDINLKSTNSKKCDTYLWAKTKYLDTGKSGPILFYNCDGYRAKLFNLPKAEKELLDPLIALNIDIAIAKKAFALDLSPFDNEVPKDDPSQRLGEDARTFNLILESSSHQAKGALIQVLGFPHSRLKYSNQVSGSYNAGGKNKPTELESTYTRLVSSFNGYITGGRQLNMANASLYALLPKPQKTFQNPGMSEDKLKENGLITKAGKVADKTFLTFIVGDFDNYSSIYNELLGKLWQDKFRGRMPLTWAINPQLVDFFPIGVRKLIETRSPIDYFAAPASGAGLVNPGFMTEEGLKEWSLHCKKYYSGTDYTITANLVNGQFLPITKKILMEYASFSPSGIFVNGHLEGDGDMLLIGATPVLRLVDIPNQEDDAADAIHNTRKEQFPNFIAVHCRLLSPSFINILFRKITNERPDRNYTVLDPYAFFDLLRRHLQSKPVGN